MPDLAVVTPSRGRPENMERLLEAWDKTIRADTKLIAGLDSSDPRKDEYPAGPRYVTMDGMERKVVGWINLLSEAAWPNHQAVGHFGDDCVPKTDGWDERILEALGKTPFAFGNDLSIERPPGSLCTHLFMRSQTLRDLTYFGPPSIQHMWVDLAWMAWGEAAGMTYLDDVVIEHMHFLEQKAEIDSSYMLSRQLVDQDLRALFAYVRDDLNRDLRKLDPDARHVSVRDFLAAAANRGTPLQVPGELLAGI